MAFEVFGQTRLGEEHVHTPFQCSLLNRPLRMPGQQDHRDVSRVTEILEVLRRSDPIEARHRQVHHNHVRLEPDCRVHRKEPVGCQLHIEPDVT